MSYLTINKFFYYLDNEMRLDVSGHIKRAGPFLLGPKLGNSPVKSMIHCLARKEGTNKFYTVKVRKCDFKTYFEININWRLEKN